MVYTKTPILARVCWLVLFTSRDSGAQGVFNFDTSFTYADSEEQAIQHTIEDCSMIGKEFGVVLYIHHCDPEKLMQYNDAVRQAKEPK